VLTLPRGGSLPNPLTEPLADVDFRPRGAFTGVFMPLRFFNTMTRAVEDFTPKDLGRIGIYTCGPTVYNFAHIGNFRAYIFEDLLQRHLEYRGIKVERVMNLTDVDDKTIRGCRAAGVSLAEFTTPFKKAFFEDLDTLRIKRADHFPEATEKIHIDRMISMISDLIAKGHAYRAEDGSVYFRIRSFPAYGQLAHFHLEDLRDGVRVSNDEYDKENAGDFALWKAWDERDGDVAWDSPWGRGRPGWHIECSAMATGLLGPEIDIHCGGEDNIFPHHEAEIAQSECVTGHRFVRLWMHCRHLQVEGTKMAKSAGNFFTLRDLREKGWSGREVRFALISVKYREPLNFTFDGLAAARAALRRLDEWTLRLHELTGADLPEPLDNHTLPLEVFGQSLDDDLNISGALAGLFEVVRATNRSMDAGNLMPGQARFLLEWLDGVHSVLAMEPDEIGIPTEIIALLDERAAARAAKDWQLSDELRDKMLAAGWQVKDTKEGQKPTPASFNL
jgi:cysteinyl-tRNA synthetase